MASIEALLPLPPSVNHCYARYGDRVVLTDAAVVYGEQVALALAGRDPVPPGCRLALAVRLAFPDRRRRDLDNALKILIDSVARALGFDDSRIDELHVYREHDRTNPRAVITLSWDG